MPPSSDPSPPTPGGGTDGVLVERYRDGDEGAAGSLHAKYARRLRALARRYCSAKFAGRFDADDIVQSAFRAFFQGVRDRRYTTPEGGEIWELLTVLALSKVRHQMEYHTARRRDVRQTGTSSDLEGFLPLDRDGTAEIALRLVLDESLTGLSESNREIVRLRLDGYQVKEIAARTGRSRRTVERVLQDFRERLTDL